jgi:hypothetical protein
MFKRSMVRVRFSVWRELRTDQLLPLLHVPLGRFAELNRAFKSTCICILDVRVV